MKTFIVVLLVILFSCLIYSCWFVDPRIKYAIDGIGTANISYTHPSDIIITDTVELPWKISFQNDMLIADVYTLTSDNGYLYIYYKGDLVSEGTGNISFVK